MLEARELRPRTRLPQDTRRDQLMDAAIGVIAEHGLSGLTLGKVAERAGLTAGMVNFHFESKQDLLEATLARLSAELREVYAEALTESGGSPADALMNFAAVCFDPRVASPEKLAVWFAYWGEGPARSSYLDICGPVDDDFYAKATALFERLVAETGAAVDVPSAVLAFGGLLDLLWWKALIEDYTAGQALADCRRFVESLFPTAFGRAGDGKPADRPAAPGIAAANDDDRLTLPARTYCSADFTAREIERVHLPAWHPVCHVGEIPAPGDYVTMDVLGKRAVVVRGEDGAVRAFHNVCRHRGHAVVAGRAGNCGPVMRCAYHAWCYDTTGALAGTGAGRTLPCLDGTDLGLLPIDSEIFSGFVFVCFAPGGPSVAERCAPYAEELEPHAIGGMVPVGAYAQTEVAADWKAVWDTCLDDDYAAAGHPVLGASTAADREPDRRRRTIRMSRAIRADVEGPWSARMYARLLPGHERRRWSRRWNRYFLYPAVAIETWPDMVEVLHVVPLGPGRSLLRRRVYGRPGADRATLAARWLNRRMSLKVRSEDAAFVESVQAGLASGVYERGALSDTEVNVKALHDWIRADLPDAR